MPEEREFFVAVSVDVRVRARLRNRPPTQYAISLEAHSEETGSFETIRLFDNAHGAHEMHRFRPGTGKMPGEIFFHGNTNAAIPAAIDLLKRDWQEIVVAYRRSSR